LSKYQVRHSDENTPEIIQAVKECGWQWIDTHDLGGGFPDGLAVRMQANIWQIIPVEIKNPQGFHGGKGHDQFTDDEKKFYAKYHGLVHVVNGRKDVFTLLR